MPHTSSPNGELRIGVIGADVPGLVTALACDFAGLGQITLHPLEGETPNRGIELRANASRVLRALGVLDALSGQGHYPQFAYRRAHRSGFLIAQLPVGQLAEARYGAPTWLLEYGDLRATLRAIVLERGINIAETLEVEELRSDEQRARVAFTAGQANYDVLVVTEAALRPLLRIEPYTIDPLETLSVGWSTQPEGGAASITTWLGEGSALTVHSTGLRLALEGRGPSAQRFADWRAPGADTGYERLPYPLGSPAPDWAAGRIALVGGAAHAPLPELRQDSSAAIEDAWVLSRLLDQWEDDPVSALRDYHRYREPRGRQLATFEARARAARRVAPGSAQLKARLAAGAMSRFLPEMALTAEDWLYSYDAVRGFA